jgi:hypothetical protein
MNIDQEKSMTKIEELELSIETLPENDYRSFRRWFLARDWKKWDEQIEKDSEKGKLDFLIQEAQMAKAKNRLKNF